MHRVTRAKPCPVCGKPDWCLVAADGSAAICQRVQDGSVKKCGDAGYLHILEDRHNRHNGHKQSAKRRHIWTVAHGQESPSLNFEQMAVAYQSELAPKRLRALARSLGVSTGSLQRLKVGWDGSAYTFPMSDGSGRVIGVRRRFPSGRKASVTGSKTGLFVPVDLAASGPLLICEGPTDTAAALDLGFAALGRPNCNSLIEMTVRAVRGRDEIVVVADNDSAGRTGAEKLARTLALHCPCVKIVVPPDGVKDLRQWFNAGLTSETLREIIAGTTALRLTVAFSRVSTGKEVWPSARFKWKSPSRPTSRVAPKDS